MRQHIEDGIFKIEFVKSEKMMQTFIQCQKKYSTNMQVRRLQQVNFMIGAIGRMLRNIHETTIFRINITDS